jgi:polyphosphate kinase 2 (PPK2 family)
VRVVALNKPTEREQHQWYFQRYVQHLPTAGETVLFDRSWYNRAVVERVMGFCDGRRVRAVHAAGAALRAHAGGQRCVADEVMVLGDPV